MAAGYAWDWISKNDNTVYDIEIQGIKKRWNHCTEGWGHSEKAIDEVLKFRDDREWKQFHNPKDLVISISLEAAELLEVFQWSAGDVVCEKKLDKIKEELADVVNYCILMADTCGLDLDEIVRDKVKKNNENY